jgi:hypothetical protein
MNVVYLLDPKTQVGYALNEYEDSYEALDKKDHLRVKYPANLFYYMANAPEPQTFYSIDEALLIVNGEDIYKDVQI